jgi:hypothetical protein
MDRRNAAPRVTVLMNEHVLRERGWRRLMIAGVADYTAHHFDEAHRSDPQAAAAGAPADVHVRILLAHQPRSAEAAADAGFDLQLSGHTHGGQFFPWNLFVPLQQPFTAGLQPLAQALWVYTSRGTGYWGPPKRFGAPSEITLVRWCRPERKTAETSCNALLFDPIETNRRICMTVRTPLFPPACSPARLLSRQRDCRQPRERSRRAGADPRYRAESDYAYERLADLTDLIGPAPVRFGRRAAAVTQVAEAMRKLGAKVTLQPVKVPHWVRGAETANWSTTRPSGRHDAARGADGAGRLGRDAGRRPDARK